MKLETAELERPEPFTSSLDTIQLDRLSQVLDDLLMQSEAGQTPDVEAACSNNPDLSQAIRYYLRSIQLLNQVAFDGRPGSKHSLSLVGSPGLEDRSTKAQPFQPTQSSVEPASNTSTLQHESLGELGDFRLIREIGRGGMGVVYEARQHSLARRVALKILPFAAVLDSRQIARFQNEAQAAASLQHPNIVPVYSVGNDRGTHFYSMQYVDGHSLDVIVAQLQDRQPVSPSDKTSNSRADATGDHHETQSTVNAWAKASTLNSHRSANYIDSVVKLFIQAADALHHAHQHGIVHRDVKPSNLMVDNQGKLWVTDFGLAQCRLNNENGAGANLTRSGDFLGTLRYMSPEQATGKPYLVDHRSDIYSLGATMYELLTLQPLVSGSERMEMIRQIDQGVVRSPRKLNPSVPVALENILLKALSTSRDDRYGSAEDLANDLRRFIAGDVPLAKRLTWLDRAGRLARQNPKPVILVLCCLATLFVISLSIAAILQHKNGQIEAALEKADQHLAVANQAVYQFGPMQLRRLELLSGSESLRLETAKEALNYFERFSRYAQSDESLQRDVASAKMICGELELQLGRLPSATKYFQSAVEILEQLRATRGSGLSEELLIELLLGRNNLAVSQSRAGSLAAAKSSLEGSLVLLVQNDNLRSSSISPTNNRLMAVEALTRLHYGQVSVELGDPLRAENEFRKALRLADGIAVPKKSVGDPHTIADELYSLMIAALLETSRLEHTPKEQARASIELGLSLAEKVATVADADSAIETAPATPSQLSQAQTIAQRDVALCRVALGTDLLSSGETQKARVVLAKAVSDFGQLHQLSPTIQQIGIDYATALNNLGQCEIELRNIPSALDSLRKSEQLLTQIGAFSTNYVVPHSLGGVYNNLSIACQMKGDLDQARLYIAQAIEHQQQALQLSPGNAVCEAFLVEHRTQQANLLRRTETQETTDIN